MLSRRSSWGRRPPSASDDCQEGERGGLGGFGGWAERRECGERGDGGAWGFEARGMRAWVSGDAVAAFASEEGEAEGIEGGGEFVF